MSEFIARVFEVMHVQYSNMALVYYYGFSVASIAGLLVLEAVCLGWSNSALKRLTVRPSRSARMDLALSFMYLIRVAPILAVLLSFGIAAVVPTAVKRYFGYEWIRSIENPWIAVLIYALMYDLLFYWKHRLSHSIGWWWQLHEIHHSAVEMNLLTANRLHPMDEAVWRLFTCLPLALAGAPPEYYLVIRALHLVQVTLTHSNLPWDWGWFGKYVLVSPAAHRVHHSDLPEHVNHNFGNMIPLWDHLFGTWYDGPRREIAVDDRPYYNHAPWYSDVWGGYARFWKSVAGSLTRRVRLSSEKPVGR